MKLKLGSAGNGNRSLGEGREGTVAFTDRYFFKVKYGEWMSKISKKIIREINLISVFEKTLRERFESTLNGFFLDDPPEMWDDEQREAFDMVTLSRRGTKGRNPRGLGRQRTNSRRRPA